MIEVDVTGLSCPLPVLKVKKTLEDNPHEKIEVIADSGIARENIIRLLDSKDLRYTVKEDSENCRFVVNKEGD